MGVDHLFTPDLLLGIAAGGSSATFTVNDRATSGRLEGDHLGAYAMQRFGASYLSAQIAYSHFNNTTTRIITGIGPGGFASDQFGPARDRPRVWIWPGVGDAVRGDTGGAAVVKRLHRNLNRRHCPRRARAELQCADRVLAADFPRRQVRPRRFRQRHGVAAVHAAWVHEFEPSRTITASLTTLPVPAFTILGASAASEAARLDLGSRLALNRWWEVSGRITGEFSNLGQSYSGIGSLKASW